jgi:hypothetical protein
MWELFLVLPEGQIITGLTVHGERLFASTATGHCYEVYANGGWIRVCECEEEPVHWSAV